VVTLDIIRNGVVLVSYHSKFPHICIVFPKEGCFFCHIKLLYDNVFKEKSSAWFPRNIAATLHYGLQSKIADKFQCRHFKIKLHSIFINVIRDDGWE